MSDVRCPDCGNPIPPGIPDGMCPHCLLTLGVAAEGDPASDGNTSRPDSDTVRAAVAAADQEQPGVRIGRYQLLEPIGEGGFGTVWMAEQEEPVRRRVALKIIKLGMDTREVVARFEAERQALAMMDHPNIARVFDGGATENGRPYFVMELVKGVRITDYCDARRLNTEERLKLFMEVCQAVQHAHQKGIIHRDLKPSNILVTEQDGRAVPKVIDFGIAKAAGQKLTEKTLFTRFNEFIGTPAYMSPEQAGLGSLDIDTRSDIYALGVLLYELLTGQTPFDSQEMAGQPWETILHIIREKEPPRPSQRLITLSRERLAGLAERRGEPAQQLPRRLRGELDWIVLKAIEKDRTERYSAVNTLALDLRRYLAHEPVSAGPPSAAYRWRKFVRKHRGTVAVAAAFLTLLIASAVVSTVLALRADRERQQALAAQQAELAQRRRAEETSEALRRRVYAADMNLAHEALRANNLGRARELMEQHRPQPGETDLRHWEWRYLWQQCQSQARLALPSHRRPIRSVAVSPRSQWIAWGGEDGALKVWDVLTRREVANLGEDAGDPAMVAFSPRGDRLAASVRKGLVKLWSTGTWTEIARLPSAGWVRAVCFSPDGTLLACMGDDRHIELWNLAQTNRVARAPIVALRDSYKGRMAFAPHQPWLVVGETDGRIRILNLPELTERLSFTGSDEGITALAFSAEGGPLATGSGYNDFSIRLWDVATGAKVGQLHGHAGWVTDLAFSGDGTTLASAAVDQTIRLWDTRRFVERTVLRGHQDEVRTLAFAPGDSTLVSGSRAGEVLFWDAASTPLAGATNAVPESVRDASFSPDGQIIAAWHWDGGLSVRNASRDGQVRRLTELGTNHYGVLFSPDGKWLAVGNRAGTVGLFNARTLREERTLRGEEAGRMLPVRFSGDGRVFLSVARSTPLPRCYLWMVETGRQLAEWPIRATNHRVELSADGRLAATGDHDGLLQLWEATTGRELKRVEAHRTGVVAVKFSPDSRMLASGSTYGEVTLWDARTLLPLASLRGQSGGIYSLAFSPDGRRLVTGGNGQYAVQVWDIATQQMVATLAAPGAQHEAVQFSPDGHALLTVNSLGGLSHWRAPSPEEIAAKARE